MATEYGITSFASAGDVSHGTSVWFMHTTRQKSRSHSAKVNADQDKRDKKNTVKRITKFGWSQVRIQPVCNAAVVPLTTQYFPQILHIVQIYKGLVYSTPHFQQDRCCTLEVGSSTLDVMPKCGLPQGSPLSPTLFLIYIDDLLHALQCIRGLRSQGFADDLAIWISTELRIGEADPHLMRGLRVVEDWARRWRIRLAPKSAFVCAFGVRV